MSWELNHVQQSKVHTKYTCNIRASPDRSHSYDYYCNNMLSSRLIQILGHYYKRVNYWNIHYYWENKNLFLLKHCLLLDPGAGTRPHNSADSQSPVTRSHQNSKSEVLVGAGARHTLRMLRGDTSGSMTLAPTPISPGASSWYDTASRDVKNAASGIWINLNLKAFILQNVV